MTDTNKLKELAERAQISRGGEWYNEGDCCWWTGRPDEGDFMAACTPKVVLELIAEVERLNDELSACTEHPGGCGYWREAAKRRSEERDRLKAENEALRQIVSECATACGAGCSPECTLDFMSMLPDEIASVVGRRARNAAIGAVVWQFIDRMNDVCLEDPAGRILSDFLKAVRPAIDAALEGGGR